MHMFDINIDSFCEYRDLCDDCENVSAKIMSAEFVKNSVAH